MAKNEDSKSGKSADTGGGNEERRLGPEAGTGGDLKDAGGRSFAPKGEKAEDVKKAAAKEEETPEPKKEKAGEVVIPATEMRSGPIRFSHRKQHLEIEATDAKVGLVRLPDGSFCFESAGSTGEDVVIRYRIVDNK